MIQNFNKRIAICIPTFNRGPVLRQNLKMLISALGKYGIKIYVSNNASTDDTKDAVLECQKEYPGIIYAENESNVGLKNFELALKMCEEEYAWLLGDDDTVSGDIEKIEACIVSNNPEIIFLDYLDKNVMQCTYSDSKKILYDLFYGMTWMSSLIIKRSVVEFLNFDKYLNTQFPHLGAIMEATINNNYRVSVLQNEYVSSIEHNCRKSYDPSSEWFFNTWAKGFIDAILMMPGATEQDAQYIIKKFIPNIFSNLKLINHRAKGAYSSSVLKKYYYYLHFFNKSPYWLLWAIAYIPKGISKMAQRLYYAFFDK